MQIILEANGLWETIEPSETTNSDTKKDKTTIAFLYQALPEEQLLQITKYKSSTEIWEALKTRHLGETRVQQARLQNTKEESSTKVVDVEDITFHAKATTINQEMREEKGKTLIETSIEATSENQAMTIAKLDATTAKS
nr:zinc finger, CCHC-type [Tanacetum cinerariifolium]